MPVVRIEMYDGRSMDQKRQLVKEVTDVVARVTGNSPEGVHVILDEVKRENWAIGGLLWPDRQRPKA
jgi:4-oxalocrotonate tautomerase